MSLRVQLPLNGNTNNQGVDGITLSGSPASYSAGKIGTAATQNGSVGNVVYNNTTAYNYTDNFSFALWVYPIYTGSTAQYAFTVGRADAGGYGYGLQVASATQVNVRFGNKVITVTCNSNVQSHIAMTVANSTINVYVNGVLVSSQAVGSLPTYSDGNGMGLGCFHYSGNIYPYYGRINDFRIYDHALSAKEVKEISKGLVVHYPLDDAFNEYTNNLVSSQYVSAGTVSGWGGHTSVWSIVDANDFPIPCNQCNKIAITYSGSGGGGMGRWLQNINCSPSSTYTYSCYIKTPDELGPLNANILYRYEYQSDGSKATEAGCWTTTNTKELGNNWYRIQGTFTTTSSTTSFAIYNFFYPNKTCDYYIGCWQLELINHVTPYVFGERNDLLVRDTSGFKYNGTVVGRLTVNTDTPKYLSSTYFNSAGYIKNDSFGVTINTFTLNMWVKPKSMSSQHFLFGTFDNQTGNGIGIWRDTGTPAKYNCLIRSASESSYSNLAITTTLNNWNMITLVYTGAIYIRYLNGVEQGRATYGSNGVITNPNFMVGNSKYNGTPASENEEAFISDVRFYATALSVDDIKELYSSSASIANNGTVMCYEFNEE